MLSCSLLFCQRLVNHMITLSLLFLLISSSTQLSFKVEGRANPKSGDNSLSGTVEQKFMRSQIGSRPPRCEGRCSRCGHCEAIQVPTNPQVSHGSKNYSTISNIEYAKGDDESSNYKPMSWKCKCGKIIFNP